MNKVELHRALTRVLNARIPRDCACELELLRDYIEESEPVKHGWWERRSSKIYACSECTNEVTNRQKQNYSFCPFCGYLMDGDSE